MPSHNPIYDLLQDELIRRSSPLYAPLLQRGIVTQKDINGELHRYAEKHRPALQEVYSIYQEHWQAFDHLRRVHDESFVNEALRFHNALSKSYDTEEFGIDHYIQRLRTANSREEFREARQFFMDRWERVLGDREYARQLIYVDKLCNEYIRILDNRIQGITQNKGTLGNGVSARLNWLAPTFDPLLREEIRKLRPVVQRNPIVRELLQVLGRQKQVDRQMFKALRSHKLTRTMQHAAHSDIVGIKEGTDLGSLLPTEYALFADEATENLFFSRLADGHLQTFDSTTLLPDHAKASQQHGHDMHNPQGEGPFVVCVDASGSMQGTPEQISKAIVLAAGIASERLHRQCKVVMFSDQIETCEFNDIAEGIPMLETFLCRTFHGGTSPDEALKVAIKTLELEDFATADLLFVSDCQMPAPNVTMNQRIQELKARGTRWYTVAFGNEAEHYYLDIADKYWTYNLSEQ